MVDARERCEWNRAALICCQIVNVAPRGKFAKRYKLADFHPFMRRQSRCTKSDLRMLYEAASASWNRRQKRKDGVK